MPEPELITRDDIMAQSRGEARSQATVIEQSRAIAEVQASFVVAQQRPRDEATALDKALKSCRTKEVAEEAFFKFRRGDGTVAGPTIHLAVELARCWGNISYGIGELSRNDRVAESEMVAYAIDLETNTRSDMKFIVPHRRDTRTGPKALTDVRDIYENNANMGARRLRECIFRVLPPYLKEAAEATCHKTLQGGGEKPLQVLLAEAIDAFEKLGVAKARIEAKLGPLSNLTEVDVANLKVSYCSITRGEVSADEEFPKIGVDEATAAARRLKDQTQGAAAPPADDEHPARRKADDIIRSAKTCQNIIDLTNIRSVQADNIAAMPDEMAAEVNRALDEAEQRLKGARK